jgi:hypothetical protein
MTWCNLILISGKQDFGQNVTLRVIHSTNTVV